MKKKFFSFLVVSSLLFSSGYSEQSTGKASKEGSVSATALTWGILGVGLLVAIGVVVAVTLSQNNDKTIVVVQH